MILEFSMEISFAAKSRCRDAIRCKNSSFSCVKGCANQMGVLSMSSEDKNSSLYKPFPDPRHEFVRSAGGIPGCLPFRAALSHDGVRAPVQFWCPRTGFSRCPFSPPTAVTTALVAEAPRPWTATGCFRIPRHGVACATGGHFGSPDVASPAARLAGISFPT
jgi:hypothetical protein